MPAKLRAKQKLFSSAPKLLLVLLLQAWDSEDGVILFLATPNIAGLQLHSSTPIWSSWDPSIFGHRLHTVEGLRAAVALEGEPWAPWREKEAERASPALGTAPVDGRSRGRSDRERGLTFPCMFPCASHPHTSRNKEKCTWQANLVNAFLKETNLFI